MTDSASRSPFNPRLVAALIVAGILAFGAFLLLSAYAQDFRSGRDGRAHALSVSAVGFQGIVKLVRLAGGRAELLRSERGLDTENLVVATVEPATSKAALESLLETRGARTTLIVLPKWHVMPLPRRPDWVAGIEPGAAIGIAKALPWVVRISVSDDKKPSGAAVGSGMLEGLSVPTPNRVQTVLGEDLTPLLVMPGRGPLVVRIGGGPLYLLADPDLLNNQGLRDPQRAQAALQLLAALNATDADTVVFDVTLNGFSRKPGLLKLPFEPPFLALTAALVVAALLAGIHGAFRFGPAAPEARAIAFGKMALVDNSAGLIQLVGREHRTGGAFADLMRDAAAHAAGAPAALRGAELDAYLDRLSPPGVAKFSALAADVGNASNRHELLSAARALFKWKKDRVQ